MSSPALDANGERYVVQDLEGSKEIKGRTAAGCWLRQSVAAAWLFLFGDCRQRKNPRTPSPSERATRCSAECWTGEWDLTTARTAPTSNGRELPRGANSQTAR